MCIAIYKPEGKIISDSYLKIAFANNPHGSGFLVGNGDLVMHKGFFSYDEFYEHYAQYRKEACLLHFRISTGGKIDKENCHPFIVNENLGFVYNGKFTINKNDHNRSGIWHLNEFYLKPYLELCEEEWVEHRFKRFFSNHVPVSIAKSKFAFLDSQGNFSLINEKMGVWEDGVWYSNNSHKERPRLAGL